MKWLVLSTLTPRLDVLVFALVVVLTFWKERFFLLAYSSIKLLMPTLGLLVNFPLELSGVSILLKCCITPPLFIGGKCSPPVCIPAKGESMLTIPNLLPDFVCVANSKG